MPRLLVNRLKPDSISQFRAAAHLRHKEASHLANSGHGAAAIYLWGYVGEMILKASWFKLIGLSQDQTVFHHDLRDAVSQAQAYGIQWSGNLHHLPHWAELLVRHRIHLGRGYSPSAFGAEVEEHTQRIYQRWRETLRYKMNRPYPSEIRTVGESAHWLLSNSLRL